MKNVALILASGTGTRCGLEYPKQFAQINDKCVLQHTVEKFQNHTLIDEIYVVTNPEYVEKVKDLLGGYDKVVKVVEGGNTRRESSYNGIMSISYDECNVLIHDGVRPFVSEEIITNCINELKTKIAVCVAIDSTDTIYVTNSEAEIIDVPVRSALKRAQTPQCFRLSLIKKAHLLAKNNRDLDVTDDCALIMHYNLVKVYTTKGSEHNIKITYSDDIEHAKKYLK